MKLHPALTNIILGLPLLKTAAASPTLLETPTLDARGDFDWPKCLPVGKESCTVYMATSDGSSRSKYRIATLYDSDCNMLQVLRTDLSTPTEDHPQRHPAGVHGPLCRRLISTEWPAVV